MVKKAGSWLVLYKAKFSLAQQTGLLILSTTVKLGGWALGSYCLNQDRVIIVSTLESKATASAHHVLCKTPASSGITWFAVPSPATPSHWHLLLSVQMLWAPLFVCVTVWFVVEREGCLPSLPGSASAFSRCRPAWCALWLHPADHGEMPPFSTLTSLLLCR